MKKIIILFLLGILLSGCATYKFRRGKEPYHKGYVVSRDDYAILEYTVGKDNTVPPITIAKERFKRRRRMVEHYYKKMGYIENHFKMLFWNPPIFALKATKGTFRLPAVAISDYKYEHDPKYREMVRKREDELDAYEEARIQKLKDELNVYIQKDLTTEPETKTPEIAKQEKPVQEVVTEAPTPVEQKVTPPEALTKEEPIVPTKEELIAHKLEEPVIPIEEKPIPKASLIQPQPIAIIIAKPTKGFSPLKVRFYGYKSYAPKGKIASYAWDFGDGDTSTKLNPVNTYYSETFIPKYFRVTLTVQDDKGNTSQTTATVEVLNR